VLAARLADAKFFYNEDRKISLEERTKKLSQVTFHQKLGTMAQKTERVMELAGKLAETQQDHMLVTSCRRAAQLSKADLLTGIVGEFPTLQGIMGGEYAGHDGEPEAVCRAIREQYLPPSTEGPLPKSLEGKILSFADRLDTIVGFFHVGIIPTGSEDPFALRRHATAIVRIILDLNWRLDLNQWVAAAQDLLKKQGVATASGSSGVSREPGDNPVNFIAERLRFYGRTAHNLRDDVMDAVLKSATRGPFDLVDLLEKMNALQAITSRPEFDPLIVGFKRAHRLTQKEQWDRKAVDPAKFQNQAEADLYKRVQDGKERCDHLLRHREYGEALELLVALKPTIDGFFGAVMVNAEDPTIRGNRLSLLKEVDDLFLSFADFSRIAALNQ
jgi:glycyl-tRNA synthetase beta chain